jgi:hypothetical protein
MAIFSRGEAPGTAQNGAYTAWSWGKPNDNALPNGEDCAVLYVATGTDGGLGLWNDLTCDAVHALLCEQATP